MTSGKLYMMQEKYEQAIEQLELAVQEDSQNFEAYYHLGRAYGLEGYFLDMASAFEQSLSINDQFEEEIGQERLHYWGKVYNEGIRFAGPDSQQWDKALKYFETATIIIPNRLPAWRNVAYVQYQMDDPKSAMGTYEHLLTESPSDTASASNLGVLYINAERYEDAIRVLRIAIEVGDHLGALTNIAVAHMELDQLKQAEEAYLRAIEIDPEQWQVHYNLGNLYWRTNDFPSARDAYRKSVDLNPEDVEARYNLAITLVALEQLDDARPLLERLKVELPDNIAVWRELGRIYALNSMIAEAEEAYARADDLSQ